MRVNPPASAPAGVDVKVAKLGVGGGGAESIQTKEVNSEPSLKWRPEGVDMVALGGENLGSHLKPPKETLSAEGHRRCVLLGAGGSGPPAPPLFLFVCSQVSASRMAAEGPSWCSRWVCRASGGGRMTLSAQTSHKHQGASYTLTTSALSVVS